MRPESRLVLASASPRRADVLRQFGVPFEVAPPHVDESVPAGMPARDVPLLLAQRKAVAAARVDAWTLGADTVGVLDDRVLGKPRDAEDAVRMLHALSGRSHVVVTGVAVAAPGGRVTGRAVVTEVTFAEFTDAQVRAYVATGEPLGKAGAYAIQGKGAVLVTELRGDYLNVVGLPGRGTIELLHETGFPLPAHLALGDEGPS